MWPRRKTSDEERDVIEEAERNAAAVTEALRNLQETYDKIREPIMTLEQRYPLLRKDVR